MVRALPESLRLTIESLDTPIGVLRIVTDGPGALRAVGWLDLEERLQRDLRRQCGARGFSLQADRATSAVSRSIRRYFAGELSAIDALPVETGGTPFQRTVWRALREIACGTTVTYGELAVRMALVDKLAGIEFSLVPYSRDPAPQRLEVQQSAPAGKFGGSP